MRWYPWCQPHVRARPHPAARAAGQISPAADVFAFGIIMWEIYTGQKPFAALAESMPAGRERSKMILSKIAVEQVRPEWPLHSPLDYMVRRSGAAPRCPDLLPACGTLPAPSLAFVRSVGLLVLV